VSAAVESGLSSEEDELQGFAPIPFYKDGGLWTSLFPHQYVRVSGCYKSIRNWVEAPQSFTAGQSWWAFSVVLNMGTLK